eukprot:300380_1
MCFTIASTSKTIVYGMDVSTISIYDNESEIWIYDQIFPIQRVMIMLNDKQSKIHFLQTHLINIPHQLYDIKQFIREFKPMVYVMEIIKNQTLLSTVTKFENLNVFERLFFEWKLYSLASSPLDKFENMIGNVTLQFVNGYFC